MEFYLIINKHCNLSCAYCYRVKSSSSDPAPDLIRATVDFVLKQSSLKKTVTFHGGEPVLSQGVIKSFLDTYGNNGIEFILYTNGTLLKSLDKTIIDRLDYLTVSVDGEQTLHDRYRGHGSYMTTMANLDAIRPIFKGHIMGRMTVPLGAPVSLLAGVRSILSTGFFDSVTWQLENTLNAKEDRDFVLRYEDDLSSLFDLWCNNLERGIVINLLPIQSVVRTLLLNEKHHHFRCGCGWNLVFVDLTNGGRCYACDELVDSRRLEIGDVYSGINFRQELRHVAMNDDCANCNINLICGGRCVRSCLTFPAEAFRFYCATVRALVRIADQFLPRIQRIRESGMPIEHFIHPATVLQEEIP